MDSEKVKEIKKALECCTNIYDCKFCPYRNVSSDCMGNLIYDMGVYINELESENERLNKEKEKALAYLKTDNYAKLKKEDMYWGYQMAIGMLETEIDRQKNRIAELEKHNNNLTNLGIEIKNEALKHFAERLKIESVNKIHETLKEFLDAN